MRHQRSQEQDALDSSLLATMASAGDESPGGDGTMNGDGLRARRTIGRDGLRAPLETNVREPTQWFDRIEPGANVPTTWRERMIDGGGHARTKPGETDPRSYGFQWVLESVIWCLDIMLDALQHIERRTRQERMVQSPV